MSHMATGEWGRHGAKPRGVGRVREVGALLWSRLRARGLSAWRDVPWLALAFAVRRMAETGIGTDECLKLGCLPLLVHYHSPVPDIDDLRARRIWDRRSPMTGIDMREERQLELLAELGRAFGQECRWPHEPTHDRYQFFTNNASFSYGCAAATHAMIRKHLPRRVIEIGSGVSSRVISGALRMNAAATGHSVEYTIIDPYPARDLDGLPGLTAVREQRVELLDVGVFRALGQNDVLFVDSGHTVRIGGDVNFLILDVLPALAPGVIIHFHDIALPFEYAEAYVTNPRFRVFWTEAYLLQAFLCANDAFEILLAMNLLMRDHLPEFRLAWPHYNPVIHHHPSHSFWIRRVGGSTP